MSGRTLSAVALLVPAIGFAGASLTHLEVILPGNPDPTAATAEGTIAVVLALGAVIGWARPRWTRPVTLGALAFAFLGDLLGLTITVLATPERVADIVFHIAIAAVVVVGLVVAARAGAASRPAGWS